MGQEERAPLSPQHVPVTPGAAPMMSREGAGLYDKRPGLAVTSNCEKRGSFRKASGALQGAVPAILHKHRRALLRSCHPGTCRCLRAGPLAAFPAPSLWSERCSGARKILRAGTSTAAISSRGSEQEQICTSLHKVEFYRMYIEALLLTIQPCTARGARSRVAHGAPATAPGTLPGTAPVRRALGTVPAPHRRGARVVTGEG